MRSIFLTNLKVLAFWFNEGIIYFVVVVFIFLKIGLPPVYTEVLMGSTAELTCDLKSTVQGDYVLLVLWYKDGETMPFYRYTRN